MKKYLIYIFLLLTLPSGLFAQVTVTGSTGADGSYTTLGLAFSAINGTAQTGNNIVNYFKRQYNRNIYCCSEFRCMDFY